VLLFDPTNAKSAAYNPLLEVRRGEWEVRDVQNIADILVDPEGSLEKRNHWEKTSHALLVGAILHVLYAEPDKTLAGVAAFLSDPKRPIESTLAAMMKTRISARRAASGHRQRRARAAQQIRQRALGRAVHRHVVSRPLPRSRRRRGDAALRLAHRRLVERRAADDALPRRAAVRHQPHQAADPPDPQPDRPPLTEDLQAKAGGIALLLMLDEFPALGRLDFFEARWPSWRATASRAS
jgi:type IV secretion system protein VirD4